MRDKLFGKYRGRVDGFFAWVIISLAAKQAYDIYVSVSEFLDRGGINTLGKALGVLLMFVFGVVILILFLKIIFGLIKAKIQKLKTDGGSTILLDPKPNLSNDIPKPPKYEHMGDIEFAQWLKDNQSRLSYEHLEVYLSEWGSRSQAVKLEIMNQQKFWKRNEGRSRFLTKTEIKDLERPSPTEN